MSDPKQSAALTKRDVAHIVETAGTNSLVSASVLSARVMTEASAYFQRSAAALEQILATLRGGDGGGTATPMAITAALDTASAKSIADTLSGTIQPQLDKHSEMIGTALAQLGGLAQAGAESERAIAAVVGEEGHIKRLERAIAEERQLVGSVLLGEGGHIRRLDSEIAVLARRVARLEEGRGRDEAPPPEDIAGYEQRAQEMREICEALRERMSTVEASIRQMMARRGPEGDGGGGSRPRRSS